MMYLFGFSINTLTLLAMVLAIGLVVDDAIVVLENIFRHIEEGMPRKQAAFQGSREIGFAVVAMTLTLVTVYAPLAFATSRTGRLFIEFALALAGAVLVSGFVALTLTPMMCSVLLRHQHSHNRWYNLIEGWLEALGRGYRRALELALRHRWTVVGVGAVVAAASGVLFSVVKSELAPIEDRGVVFGIVSAPEGATLNYTLDSMLGIEQFYAAIPEAATAQVTVGFPTVTDGTAILRLTPWEERTRRQQQIAQELQPKFASLPGVRAFPTNPPSLGQSARSKPVEFIIMSQASYPELAKLVGVFTNALRDYPGLQNIDTDLRLNTPELRVHVDRDKMADVGASVEVVGRTLESMLGAAGHAPQGPGRTVRRDRAGGAGRPRHAHRHLGHLRAGARWQHGAAGQPAVGARKRVAAVAQPLQPLARGQGRRGGGAGLCAGRSARPHAPGGARRAAQYGDHRPRWPVARVPRLVGQHLPGVCHGAGLHLPGAGGPVRELAQSLHHHAVGAAVDDRALLALWLTGGTLSIYSQIGLITLVGLITKHGILIVEFANQLRDQGKAMHEAVVEASVLRLRPILMTTGAMVLGTVPLALAQGAGAESRQQIGWVLVGGLMLGTLLTLFVVPVAYSMIAAARPQGQRTGASHTGPAVAPPASE